MDEVFYLTEQVADGKEVVCQEFSVARFLIDDKNNNLEKTTDNKDD